MTCCAEDMTFLGYICKYDGADSLENQSWVKVKAELKKEYVEDYHGEGPVLYASSVEKAEKPKQEVIGIG